MSEDLWGEGAFPDQLSYILNELGEDREHYYQAVSPPIMQTTNFAFKTIEDLKKAFEDEYGGYLYSRGLNPTSDILRKKLAALDGAEDCLAFNSGSSAVFAAVVSQVKAGDHIVSVKNPYSWTQKLLNQMLSRFGVTTTYIDGSSIEAFEKAILPNTRAIYLESPNSWDLSVQDLRAVAELGKAEGIVTICDNSYCTPLYQQPIAMGIDLSLQSATKYIGGHSDAVAGALSGKKETLKKIFNNEMLIAGNVLPPFNAWLLIRGLRTLPVRLERSAITTRKAVDYFKQHPKVEETLFPLDPSFPQYELARSQMKGACGLATIVLRAKTKADVARFCESLKHILIGVSWGGYESLAVPKCAGLDPADFDAGNREHKMIRFYFGLEDPQYLIDDLEQAFSRIPLYT